MKHKQKFFDIGRSTYFNHHYGVVFRKKKLRVSALYASMLLVLAGGFFSASEFAIPAINRHIHELQNRKPAVVESVIPAELTSNESSLPGIKQEDEVLKSLVQEKLATFPKDQKWSVFMYELDSGSVVNVDSQKIYASASLYKLFLLNGLEAKLPFDKWSKTKLPDKTTIKDCVDAMLKSSDSACAEQIGEYVGWDSIDQLNQKDGFANTKVAKTGGRTTSAADVGELLIRLKTGQTLSDKARRFVFDSLYQPTNTKGIALGCNACRAADKIGEITGIAHDAGIITHGTRSYALVIMSEGGNFDQIADLTKTIEQR